MRKMNASKRKRLITGVRDAIFHLKINCGCKTVISTSYAHQCVEVLYMPCKLICGKLMEIAHMAFFLKES